MKVAHQSNRMVVPCFALAVVVVVVMVVIVRRKQTIDEDKQWQLQSKR